MFARKVEGDQPLNVDTLLDELSVEYADGVYDLLVDIELITTSHVFPVAMLSSPLPIRRISE